MLLPGDEQIAEVGENVGLLRHDDEGLAKKSLTLVYIATVPANHAHEAQVIGVTRVQGKRFPAVTLGPREVPRLAGRCGLLQEPA